MPKKANKKTTKKTNKAATTLEKNTIKEINEKLGVEPEIDSSAADWKDQLKEAINAIMIAEDLKALSGKAVKVITKLYPDLIAEVKLRTEDEEDEDEDEDEVNEEDEDEEDEDEEDEDEEDEDEEDEDEVNEDEVNEDEEDEDEDEEDEDEDEEDEEKPTKPTKKPVNQGDVSSAIQLSVLHLKEPELTAQQLQKKAAEYGIDAAPTTVISIHSHNTRVLKAQALMEQGYAPAKKSNKKGTKKTTKKSTKKSKK